jgi:TP901 family phage tail tape measure protein
MTDLATLELRVQATQVDRARDSLGRFTKAGKQAEGAALGFGKSARSLERGAGSLNLALGGLVTTMLSFQGIRKVSGVLQEFEDGMVRVKKTTGLSGAALLGFERDLEILATNSSLAAGGLFEIAESAGQLGIRGREDLGSFTDAIAKLADAAPSLAGDIGNTSLEMGKLLSITNTSAKDTFNLASVIARLGDEYATTEDKVLGTGLEIAKAGSAYGVSAENALGLAAAFDSVGTEAEAARTAVLTVFTEMEKAIAGGGKELQIFATLTGQSAEAFADSFGTDAVGAFEDFSIGLGSFIEQGGKSSILLDKIGLASKRVASSLLPLAKNSDRLADVLATSSDEFGRGDKLQREYAIGSDRLGAAISRLNNTMGVMVDNLLDGKDGVAGGLRTVVEDTTDVIRVLAGMDDQVRGSKKQADLFAAGIVGLTAALGTYVAASAAAAIGTATLSAVLLANPLGLGAIAIGAAAAALYRYKDAVVEVGGEVTTIGNVAEVAFEIIADRAQLAFRLMFKFAKVGAEGVGHLFFLLGKGFGFVLGEMLDATKNWGNKVIALFAIPLEFIGTRFARVGELLKAIAGFDIKNPLTWGDLAKTGKELADISTSFEDLGKSVEKSFDKDYIGDAVGAGLKTGKEFAEAMARGLKNGLAIAIGGVGENPFAVFRKLSLEGIEEDFASILKGKGKKSAGLGNAVDFVAGRVAAASAAVAQFVLEVAKLPKGKPSDRSGIAGLVGGGNHVSAADALHAPLADLNLQINTALLSDRDAAKATALAGISAQLANIGLSAEAQGPYLDQFDQKLEKLADLNRIREVSREFAGAFGGALKDVLTDIDNLEDAFKRLGDNLASVALDRFVVDPFVDNLAQGFGDAGANLAGIDPAEDAINGLVAPSKLASTTITDMAAAATLASEALLAVASSGTGDAIAGFVAGAGAGAGAGEGGGGTAGSGGAGGTDGGYFYTNSQGGNGGGLGVGFGGSRGFRGPGAFSGGAAPVTSRGGGGGDTYNTTHTWNISTPNSGSFRDSQRAIQDKASQSFQPRRSR